MVESREKARALIMAGEVAVDGRKVEKPGHSIPVDADVVLNLKTMPYVSRGGLKLAAGLDHFRIDVAGRVILDAGASTGGFTDCLLQRGAARVIAVDVGYGQLHWKLRKDPRVIIMERTNVRYLKPEDLPARPEGAVIDTSFISLRLVVPSVARLLPETAFILALVKPQFEVGKGRVGKGGVVRDPEQREAVIRDLTVFFHDSGWNTEGHIRSPILGPKGNQEFLILLKRTAR
jgi:23S rRNA (cytidine1920-2'-O)/16S rRNA (cytidine1409-2'-O)-methyltransferase